MTPPRLDEGSEREAFEAWARDQNWICDRNSFGEYVYATARDGWDAYQAGAALSTGRLGGEAPQGWKLVPVEPTDGMLKEGNKKTWPLPSQHVYKAMLAAAPAAQSQGDSNAQ